MGKSKSTPAPAAPAPDPALAAQIDALTNQLNEQRSTQAQADADWRSRESQWLQIQSDNISARAQSDSLAKSLTETNGKLLDAQATAAAMQVPTRAPDAPVTDIPDDAAAVADAQRRAAEKSKARRSRQSLLIPAIATGSAGTGLAIPG